MTCEQQLVQLEHTLQGLQEGCTHTERSSWAQKTSWSMMILICWIPASRKCLESTGTDFHGSSSVENKGPAPPQKDCAQGNTQTPARLLLKLREFLSLCSSVLLNHGLVLYTKKAVIHIHLQSDNLGIIGITQITSCSQDCTWIISVSPQRENFTGCLLQQLGLTMCSSKDTRNPSRR